MAALLIVDDDARLRNLVRTYAELDGHECEEAGDGAAALQLVKSRPFDLIILDVMMPGPDGFEILEKIREFSEIPIIMLSARGEEYDRLQGFRLGVDDYVTKPFSPRELMARVTAILRRNGQKTDPELVFGGLVIQPASRIVTIDGRRINLAPKEYDLLLKLAQNEHIVLSRERLLESVWGYQFYGDGRTVDTHVKSLRDRLGPYRAAILTVWGVGYKFEYAKESIKEK